MTKQELLEADPKYQLVRAAAAMGDLSGWEPLIDLIEKQTVGEAETALRRVIREGGDWQQIAGLAIRAEESRKVISDLRHLPKELRRAQEDQNA